MKKSNAILLMMLFSLTLTACSNVMFKNRDHEYLQSYAVPALQTPQGVSNVKLHEDYPVSGEIYTSGKAPSLVPPGSLAASQGQK